MASPDDAQKALANVGDDARVQSATDIEPPSGIQGEGTKDSPYDAGNAPETTAQTSTTEPTQQAPVPPQDSSSVEKTQAETATKFDAAKAADTPGRDAKRTPPPYPTPPLPSAIQLQSNKHPRHTERQPGARRESGHATRRLARRDGRRPGRGLRAEQDEQVQEQARVREELVGNTCGEKLHFVFPVQSIEHILDIADWNVRQLFETATSRKRPSPPLRLRVPPASMCSMLLSTSSMISRPMVYTHMSV